VAEEIQTLADRPGWTIDGNVATYAPRPGAWTAKVRVTQPDKYHATLHVAIIDASGNARSVSYAGRLDEAVRVAEGSARALNSVNTTD
jgi:hypothetical protein